MSWYLVGIFLASSLQLATPLLLAAIGEVVSERAGVLNISLEGLMLIGAFASTFGAWQTGNPMLGLLFAIVAVLPVAALQAALSVTLGANQIVTGLGMNILALGGTTLAYREIFGTSWREIVPGFDVWTPPLLGHAPVIGTILSQPWLFYFALAVSLATAVVLQCTGFGLALRATGDAPEALDKAGRSIALVRYAGVLFAGVMAALAGAYIAIGEVHTFAEGMTNGRGYLAIVAVIFGNWSIRGTTVACLVFGAATALQFQLPAIGVPVPVAVLFMLPYVLALLAVGGLVGRQTPPRALTLPFRRVR